MKKASEVTRIAFDLPSSYSRVRYTHIVDAIAEGIESGRLGPNQRLPTQRELAQRERIAVGTVSRAYAEAERLGLIVGEVGRGTFVAPNPETARSMADGGNYIDLTINRPPPQGVINPFRAALRRLAKSPELARVLGHQPDGGVERHRSAAAAWIGGTGMNVAGEQVVICNGVQHALAALFGALARPGDLVLTEALNYPGIRLLAQIYDLRIQGVAIDAQGLVPAALDEACGGSDAKFLFCTPTVHNPTSAVIGPRRREEIAALVERHGLTLIEDDIYGLLPRERILPIAALVPARSFYVTGTSKCMAEGVRLGYAVAPVAEAARIATAVQASTWVSSPVMAEIVSQWLKDGTADKILDWHRNEAAARQMLAHTHLGRYDYAAHPVGYHIWLNLPDPWRSEQFVAQARRNGILIVPAEAFVVGRGAAPHSVRISVGGLDDRRLIETGLRGIARLLCERPQFQHITV
jgi:DNA-binding transcriptional MocR family regulator